jgi:HlyD family secretion protein
MQAGLKESVENLSRTTIYSPIDGIVTQLNVELGERVVGTSQMLGTEMMRIADMRVIQARVDISESDILKVKIGDTSIVEVDAYPNRKFKGIVKEIANAATSATANFSEQVTNYSVKINLLPESYADLSAKLKNPFRPGLSASVEVITNRSENVISVPIASVTLRAVSDSGSVKTKEKLESEERRNNLREGKENADIAIDKDKFSEVIFVVENGEVKSIPVKTGIQDENYFEIKSVLSDSAQVITGPFTAISKELKGGEKVKVVKKEMLFGGK